MASCMISRSMRFGVRPQRRSATITRAEAQSTKVSFKVTRHVDFGQSVLLVGSAPELGAWDAKRALELNWSAGDNWSASVTVPARSSMEYKYIVKRKDGLDWCPGQNKAVVLPEAAAVEVSDSWDNRASSLAVLKPLPAAPAPAPAPAVEAPVVAAVAAAPAAATTPAPAELPSTTAMPIAPEPAATYAAAGTNGVPPPEVVAATAIAAEAPSPVNTMDNILISELMAAPAEAPSTGSAAAAPTFLETTFEPCFPAPPPPTSPQQPQEGPGAFAANNIVQTYPKGAVPLGGSSDPITQYEEADSYKVVDVVPAAADKGPAAAAAASATAVATEARPAKSKPLDSMTVSQLKAELKRRGLSSFGNRRELIVRLRDAGAL